MGLVQIGELLFSFSGFSDQLKRSDHLAVAPFGNMRAGSAVGLGLEIPKKDPTSEKPRDQIKSCSLLRAASGGNGNSFF
jgi:hypothetical protein